jgi:hypothetical protein
MIHLSLLCVIERCRYLWRLEHGSATVAFEDITVL